jgi:chlorobactene glucosyltransferase
MLLTHICAASAIAYALRVVGQARTWFEVSLLTEKPEDLPFVSIIVPARNEERQIERCVRSLLAQEWVDFEIVAVDDVSTDATPQILARLAAEDSRLHVVEGAPLPPGWVGKPWALHQATQRAQGEWMLFTDADTEHAPRGVASALEYAVRSGLDVFSPLTDQELVSLAERAVLPSIFNLIVFAIGSLAEINDPARPQNAVLNGQYILIKRSALLALGGYAAVRDQIAEDLELARLIKRDGRFRLQLAGGKAFASTRMYRSFGEIWAGFTKNVFTGTGGNAANLLLGALFLFSISATPPLLAVRALARRRYVSAIEAAACSLLAIGAMAYSFGRSGVDKRLALWQPFGTAVFAAIALNSAFRVLSGRGVEWRGRTYSGKPGEALASQ